MANSPINYPRDVQPLENDGLTDAEIASEINKLSNNDIESSGYRTVLLEDDALYTDASNGLMEKGSLGEAPVQAPTEWALDPTLQRDLDKMVNFLWRNTNETIKSFSSQSHATRHYNALLNFRQFRYDRDTIDDLGNPVVETQRRALDDDQVTALYDLGGGFMYGPPTSPTAATEAEVTQSRVDYDQGVVDSAQRASNEQAARDMDTRSQSASTASWDAYRANPNPNSPYEAEITQAGEDAFNGV